MTGMSYMRRMNIESGIPVPTPSQKKWADMARSMRIGDSVMVTFREYALLYQALKNLGFGCTRQMHGTQYRCWKVARRIGVDALD